MEPSTKKRRCSAGSQVADAGPTCDSSSNLNVPLTYDVLRIIFKYLNARDLSNAVIACKSWSEAAIKEYSTRGPCYFVRNYSAPGQIVSQLVHQIRDLPVKPCVGIIFMFSEDILKGTSSNFPSYCKIVALSASGIVVDNDEMEYYTSSQALFTFLPQIPNVDIHMFEIMKLDLRCGISEKVLDQILCRLPPLTRDTSTCLMLFCNDDGYQSGNFLFRILKRWHNSKLSSVWGGIVDVRYMRNSCWQNSYGVAIVISGAIKTWSIIIDSKCNTEELIEKKLKSFKERITLKKHSMGFMFACKARGTTLHKKKNVESTIFKKLFPKIPLVGCFGDGEFGKNTMDDLGEEIDKKQTKIGRSSKVRRRHHYDMTTYDSWHNELSTIFMILSYG